MTDEQRKALYRDIMQVFTMLPEEEKSFVSGYIIGTIEAKLPTRDAHGIFSLSHAELQLENAICWNGKNIEKAQDGKICIAERTIKPEGARYLLRFPT